MRITGMRTSQTPRGRRLPGVVAPVGAAVTIGGGGVVRGVAGHDGARLVYGERWSYADGCGVGSTGVLSYGT
jgi:hypothetical protein